MFVSLIKDLSTPGEENPILLQVVVFLDCKMGNVLHIYHTIFKLLVPVTYVG